MYATLVCNQNTSPGTALIGISTTSATTSYLNNQYGEFAMPYYQYGSNPPYYLSSTSLSTVLVVSSSQTYYIVFSNNLNTYPSGLNGTLVYSYIKIA